MISRILVPIDDSEIAREALKYVFENHPDAEITVLHVVGEPSPMMGAAIGLALEDDLEAAAEERAKEVLDSARELAAEYGVEISTDVQVGQAVRAILNQAADFEMVVIGSHGGSVSDRLFVGNVAQKVLHQSPVPVTVVR